MSQPLPQNPAQARTPTPMPTPRQDDDTTPTPHQDDDTPRSLPSEQTEPPPPSPHPDAPRPLASGGLVEPPPPRPAFVTTLKAKPARHQKGAPKARPGKLSWVHGTKKKFFERRKEDWLRESEEKRVSAFLTKMAKLFIKKYGRDIRDDQDLAEDVADPPDEAANEVVHEVLTEEEQAFRADHLKTLRSRIGYWYRSEYGALLRADKETFKELFTGVLDSAPLKPQRGRLNHFYSRKFYDTRIKPHVDARMESLKRRAEFAGEAEPELIDVVAKVTAEQWELETPEFQRECEVAKEREHDQAVAAWKASMADSPSRTPEEIASTLENAAYYLQPFVDAIQARFGMCATVLLAGPIGIRGGRIGVQSVHAGTTKGLAPVNWPTFDWAGFKRVENSMITFARECFSDAECQARAVASPDGEDVESSAGPAAAVSNSGSAGNGGGGSVATGLVATGSQVPRVQPVVLATGASASTPTPVDVQMGNGDDGEEGSEGVGAGEGQGGGQESVEPYDEHWQRDDRANWTPELGRAHLAFEIGRKWGMEWAVCVRKFYDFEAAWGFVDEGAQMGRDARPPQVNGWLSRGRKWTLPPTLGVDLGTRETAELWTGLWWNWWKSLQPRERSIENNGELSRPELADWSEMAELHGKNGLLQVMATLVWWGEVAQKRDSGVQAEWLAAVNNVTWVLERVLASGEIVSHNADNDTDADEAPAEKRKRKASGGADKKKTAGKEKAGEVDAPPKKKQRKATETDTPAPRRATRLQAGGSQDAAGNRRSTRKKSDVDASGAEGAKGGGKKAERPKPRPAYRGRR